MPIVNSQIATPLEAHFSKSLAADLEGTQFVGKPLLGLLKDFGRGVGGVDLNNPTLLIEVIDDRHARLDESAEPLADRLGIVVRPPASLSPLQQPGLHDLLGAVVKEDKLGRAHGLLELVRLIQLTREAVDEELSLLGARLGESLSHGVLEQLYRDLHGDNQTILNVVANQVAKLRARALLFGAEEVTSREMGETVLGDEAGALSALAGAGTAKNEKDGDVGGGKGRGRLGALSDLASSLGGIDSWCFYVHRSGEV